MVTGDTSLVAWFETRDVEERYHAGAERVDDARARTSLHAANALAGTSAKDQEHPVSSARRAPPLAVLAPSMMTSSQVRLAFTHGIGWNRGGPHEHRSPTSGRPSPSAGYGSRAAWARRLLAAYRQSPPEPARLASGRPGYDDSGDGAETGGHSWPAGRSTLKHTRWTLAGRRPCGRGGSTARGGGSAPVPFPVCTQFGGQAGPDIAGAMAVWTDNRNGNLDIYGRDLSTRKDYAVCTNRRSRTTPR